MIRVFILLAAVGLVSACGDGQPFFNEDDPAEDDGGGDGGGDDGDGSIGGDPDLPPGTDEPTTSSGIFRFEAGDDVGGGFVQDVSYNAARDEFTVDNLAFDGNNVYQRGDAGAVRTLGGYAVYESNPIQFDPVSGQPVGQLTYRAIYGVSRNSVQQGGETLPRTQFAIVRTGSYVDYGFGGFIYERSGGVELPTTGNAVYSGEYAGQRVFSGAGGQEFTRGDVEVAIDFDDFNDGAGVQGTITNRAAFDINGDPIRLGSGDDDLFLPTLRFEIGPGATTENGEISANLQSLTVSDDGGVEVYESGTYYAIIAGEDASEIVGVFVVESQDPRFENVTAQETGGFIVYR